MPIQRRQGESKDEFISRCIPVEIKSGKSQEQAAAICYSYWDEKQLSAVKRIRKQQMFHRVSIDYDGTLSTDKGKELAKKLISEGHDVYIISARRDNEGMLGVAKDLGIPPSRVIATGSNKAKVEKIKQLNISTHYDNNPDVVNELPKVGHNFMNFESYNDYPEAAKENAKIALRWADENGWGSCGTPVGKQRANQLANGENISEDTISRMAAFERHRQNSQKELGDGCGRLMWLAWGGDEGIAWAQRKLEQIRNQKLSHFEKVRVGVQSSNVDKMMWNSETLELVIRFNDGSTYTYSNVSESIFNNVSEGNWPPKTSGENEYGSWEKGIEPSVGAAVHHYLINNKGIGVTKGGTFR